MVKNVNTIDSAITDHERLLDAIMAISTDK